MAPSVPHTSSCTHWDGTHDTQNTMLSSQCRSNTSLAGTQTREVTATGLTSPSSLQRRPFHGLSLLLLAVLAGGAVTPVHGGLMDFAPPGIIQYGTCSQPKAHESFHFRQFQGLWYQVEMVPNSYMEATKCITLDFKWNGEAYNVTTDGLNEYNEKVQQNGNITRVQPQDPTTMRPYLQIWAPGVPPVPYHVVRTDYNSFACVYSCYELFSLMFEAFSILSRTAEVDDASLAACHQAFDELELDLTRLEPVQQTQDCLGVAIEGSGEELEHQDEEEEEDENALAALTSEEVNQRRPPNPASVTHSGPAAAGEGETMMEEEMEDLVEEVEGRGGRGRGRGRGGGRGGARGKETLPSSSSQSKNRTVVAANIDSKKDSNEGSVKLPNSRRRLKQDKGRLRKPMKGRGQAGGDKKDNTFQDSRDPQLYLDDLSLDSLYQGENRGQGRGRGGKGKSGYSKGDTGSALTTSTKERLPLLAGSGGAPHPAPLLLIALLSLALCARIPSLP